MARVIIDKGIVLSARRSGEKSLIVRCFLAENGVVPGLFVVGRRDYEVPLVVDARWTASGSGDRDLGFYRLDSMSFAAQYGIINPFGSLLLTSALALCDACVPQHQSEPLLWELLHGLIVRISEQGVDRKLIEEYLGFEVALLCSQGVICELGVEAGLTAPKLRQDAAIAEDEMLVRTRFYHTAQLLARQCIGGKLPFSRLLVPKVVQRVYAAF